MARELESNLNPRFKIEGRPDSQGKIFEPNNNLYIDQQLDLEKAGHSRGSSSTASPCSSLDEPNVHTVVSFGHGDKTNPYNWSQPKKLYVVWTCVCMVLNSTIGSSIAAGSTRETAQYLHITNELQLVLPVSIYLIGYVLGPLVFSPLSETYGRKIVMLSTFTLFTAFTLGCALAPTWSGLVIMRLLVGIGASTPVSVIGGIYADIYSTPKARGRAITCFMAGTTFGPLIGPIASGFVAVVSWRWSYWVLLIIAGATWPLLLFMPETYGPIVLRNKARLLRKETGDLKIAAPIELEKQELQEICMVVLTRPIRMFLFEAIVLCSCLYLAVAYAIFYMFFQAYPIIFQGIYGFNAGEEGLAFLPIGVGSLAACAIYLWWDRYLDIARARPSPPKWIQTEEYRRMPLACLGGPLFVVSLFWLGWTARSDVHWAIPVTAAFPFGIGFLLLFMALINYIVDAYEIFAASATGAAACSRSIFSVLLPFAAKPMYDRLGVAWACSLLGFLSLGLCIIPLIFIRYGDRVRANSKFCQELKRKKEEQEEKDGRQGGRE